MGGFFEQAGPLAVPVLVLGGASLLFSLMYVRTRNPGTFALAIGSTVVTVLAGLLGTVVGFQVALRHLPDLADEKRWLVAIGMLESMNDLVLGLFFAIAAAVIVTLGAFRGRSSPSAASKVAQAHV